MQAGVFTRLWEEALQDYDDLIELNFAWMAIDSSLHKAPLGGKKTGPNPTDCGKGGVKRSLLTEARGISVVLVMKGANRHNMNLTESILRSMPPRSSSRPRCPPGGRPRPACVLGRGLRLRPGARSGERAGLHGPHPPPGRGEEGKSCRATGPALGGRTHPFLVQLLLAPAHPLGQKAQELPGHVTFFLCLSHMELLPIGVAAKQEQLIPGKSL